MTTEAIGEPKIQESDKLADARKIVRKNMYWAMGIGVVPVPIVDIVGIAAFQVKALKELSNLYGITFYEHKVKNSVASLLSGMGGPYLGGILFGSVVKFIPALGSVMGIASVPIAAGAVTYALGKVFIQHFESGGTFLDLNPEKVRAYFNSQIKVGLKMAEESTSAGDSTKKTAQARS